MSSATYEKLLVETLPQVIETEKQYGEIGDRLGDLVGKGRSRTRDETRLMRLLGLLIEDYDRMHGMPDEEDTPPRSSSSSWSTAERRLRTCFRFSDSAAMSARR